jgi:formate dehydrogenase major subunit
MDPRRTDIARHASMRCSSARQRRRAAQRLIARHRHEGLDDDGLHRRRTEGYEALRANVRRFSPEAMAPVCGIDAVTMREVARLTHVRAAMILWGMGISQHVHGTDNVRCLIALALMTGQIGRPGTGLHPLRGQNNVQGASDAGLIPMMLPDYQRVDDAVRARFEKLWGVPPGSDQPGLTVVEILMRRESAGRCGHVHHGREPGDERPRPQPCARGAGGAGAPGGAGPLPDRDAALADVVLPASAFAEKTGTFTNTDRTVQLGRRRCAAGRGAAGPVDRAGDGARARPGLALRRPTAAVAAVFEEMRRAMPSHRRHLVGSAWSARARHLPLRRRRRPRPAGGLHRPLPHRQRPRPLRAGRHRAGADELPDADYPLVLITGRQLEHWHTGSMTRPLGVLDALEPGAHRGLAAPGRWRAGLAPARVRHAGVAAREVSCGAGRAPTRD